MIDLTSDLLPALGQAHPLLGGLGGPITWPAYQGQSIANLPASICRWLGVEPPVTAAPPLQPRLHGQWGTSFQNVVLLLVDGFGLDRAQQRLAQGWTGLGETSSLAPLTSVVPSTTSAALTTLWSGALPAEHGVIGYEVFLKEFGLIANMITHAPAGFPSGAAGLMLASVTPAVFLPVEPLGVVLRRQGVQPYAFIHRSIAHSGLSSVLHREAITSPILGLTDLFVSLDQLLDEPAAGPRYIYAYWSSLDDLSHRFGPGDLRVAREADLLFQQIELFLAGRRARGKGDTLFLLTADHGHIETPPDPRLEVHNHPALLECLVMGPSGEARLPYLFVKAGREAHLRGYVQQAWGERFPLASAADFLSSGLLGNRAMHPHLADRLGDFVVLPQGEDYWYFGAQENILHGRHGGVSRTEMLVPMFSAVL